MRPLLLFIGGVLTGVLAAGYAFVLNGYQTEFIPPRSDRWYQLIRDGHFPEPVTLGNSEVRSNGHILEVFGTLANPRDKPVRLQKVSADLFDSTGKFIHKCEHVRVWQGVHGCLTLPSNGQSQAGFAHL